MLAVQKSPFDPVSTTIDIPPAHLFYPYLQRVRKFLTRKALNNILYHQKHWQRRYNRNRRDLAYHIGDLVYVQVHAGRSKLDVCRFGPCTLIQTSGQQHDPVRNNLNG